MSESKVETGRVLHGACQEAMDVSYSPKDRLPSSCSATGHLLRDRPNVGRSMRKQTPRPHTECLLLSRGELVDIGPAATIICDSQVEAGAGSKPEG